MKTAHLLFNPASGSFSLARANQVQHLLRDAGISCHCLYPTSAAEAAIAVRHASLAADEPLIIAIGGDGTVNTALNGIANPRAILGYIPLGTANVLARELAIGSCAAAVARISTGATRAVTVGKISSSAPDRYFLLMAGIGFDGAVVADVRSPEKRQFGKGAYLLAALRQLRQWDTSPLTVTVTSNNETLAAHSVIACNAIHYGGAFRLAAEASMFSPTFQLVGVVGCRRQDLLLWALQSVMSAVPPAGQRCWSRHVSQVAISGAKAVQVDGDTAGQSPLTITALPEFVRLII